MEWDELNGIVWKYLVEAGEEKNVQQISEDIGFDDEETRKIVSVLSNIGLVKREKKNAKFFYEANAILSPMQWARGVEVGVPVEHLEKHAKLDSASGEDSLTIATDGTLEKYKEEELQQKLQKRKDYIYGKAATEAAASHLTAILKLSADALREFKLKKEQNKASTLQDTLVETLLEQAHNEMKRSYDSLIAGLVRKSL